jgi:alkylation response protein AidB-like acyl-CoA dehydrogenase
MEDMAHAVGNFARRFIAPRTDLHSLAEFPFDIWEKMGEEGLLGMGIPQRYGGRGADHQTLSAAGEALVRHGHNLGLAASWLLHELVARFLVQFGTAEQHGQYLGKLAEGRITGCFAVSEPGRGSHPKQLATRAQREGSDYILDGEKTYLTNGPIAGLFLVVAVSEASGTRKEFTAFLVPRETPGLTLAPPLALPFLRPSPHGGIVLAGCRVPQGAVVGVPGRAYGDMVLPFREIEDTMMMGPVVGGAESQIASVVRLARQSPPPELEELEALESNLGKLQAMISVLRLIAREGVRALDGASGGIEAAPLTLAFRHLAAEFQADLSATLAAARLAPDDRLSLMTNDLVGTGQIAGNVARLKQRKLGAAVLAERQE